METTACWKQNFKLLNRIINAVLYIWAAFLLAKITTLYIIMDKKQFYWYIYRNGIMVNRDREVNHMNGATNEATEKVIIKDPVSSFRDTARLALTGKWKIGTLGEIFSSVFSYLVGIAAELVSLAGLLVVMLLTNIPISFELFEDETFRSINSLISLVLLAFVQGAITLGLTNFSLSILRGGTPKISFVLSGFNNFFKSLSLYLRICGFMILWMIPGIVVFILLLSLPYSGYAFTYILLFAFLVYAIIIWLRYSMAFFLLSDNPSIRAKEAMKQSIEMMKGNKVKYFLLNLSFIGWMLLGILCFMIVATLFIVIPLTMLEMSVVCVILLLIGFIVSFLLIFIVVYILSIYVSISQSAFYERVSGRADFVNRNPHDLLNTYTQSPNNQQQFNNSNSLGNNISGMNDASNSNHNNKVNINLPEDNDQLSSNSNMPQIRNQINKDTNISGPVEQHDNVNAPEKTNLNNGGNDLKDNMDDEK